MLRRFVTQSELRAFRWRAAQQHSPTLPCGRLPLHRTHIYRIQPPPTHRAGIARNNRGCSLNWFVNTTVLLLVELVGFFRAVFFFFGTVALHPSEGANPRKADHPRCVSMRREQRHNTPRREFKHLLSAHHAGLVRFFT